MVRLVYQKVHGSTARTGIGVTKPFLSHVRSTCLSVCLPVNLLFYLLAFLCACLSLSIVPVIGACFNEDSSIHGS